MKQITYVYIDGSELHVLYNYDYPTGTEVWDEGRGECDLNEVGIPGIPFPLRVRAEIEGWWPHDPVIYPEGKTFGRLVEAWQLETSDGRVYGTPVGTRV